VNVGLVSSSAGIAVADKATNAAVANILFIGSGFGWMSIQSRPKAGNRQVATALYVLIRIGKSGPDSIIVSGDRIMLTKRYDDALLYASELHRTQVRKGTSIPYMSHLLSVSALVLKSGGDEDQAIAGLLHDAAEDQGGKRTVDAIRDRFGDRVANIVADCTDSWVVPKPPWRERKEAYIESLPAKMPESLLVSLADKTDNARAILGDFREVGDDVWNRFSGKKDGTRWYYQSLSEFFSEKHPCPLAAELARTVAAFVAD
jgi:hypothetical protein